MAFRVIGRVLYGFATVFGLSGVYALLRGDVEIGLLLLICTALVAMLAEGVLYTGRR